MPSPSLHFKPEVGYRMLVVKCCMLLPAMIITRSGDFMPMTISVHSLAIRWAKLETSDKLGIVTIELYRAHTPCALGICAAKMVINMAGPRTATYVYVQPRTSDDLPGNLCA